jgi:outer membrane protein OmpA-like peptidoglycan-associated protein
LRRSLTLAAFLAAVLVAPAASATHPFTRGFDVVPTKFTPTMDSLWAVDGAELNTPKSFHIDAILDMNFGILSLKSGQTNLGELINFRADLHLMGSYVFHRRFELSADIPFIVGQVSNFKLLRDQGFTDQRDPSAGGLGDWRFIGRFQVLFQESFFFGLALIGEIRLPFGDQGSFFGDSGWVFAPRAAIERRFGPVRVAVNGGWRFRPYPGQYLNLYVGQEFVMGAGAQVDLPNIGPTSKNMVIGEINFATPAEAPFTFDQADSLKTPLELLVGARSTFYQHFSAQLAIGRGLGTYTGYGREAIRIMLGVRYMWESIPDRDGDGVPDKIDRCPDEPGPASNQGCPVPDIDTDGDGIPDRIDACPEVPGPKEYDGCPDKDGDQIPDNVDKCPDDPGPAETEGCPVPQEDQVTLESDRIRIKGNILYETGQAVIQKQSFKILDDVAKVLLEHLDVGPVLIEGHTDNRGGHDYNLDLSNRRAKAVENYLVGKGVDRKRLRSQGFSYDRPIATNDTPLGRAKNRRTDFKLVEADSEDKSDKGGKKDSPAPK